MTLLKKYFYQRDPVIVAKDLLGKLLVRKIGPNLLIGKIVETEAYLAYNDLASHSVRGKTKATSSLYLAGGHAYIHRIHKYHCFDVVCGAENSGGSVLIRALEPIEGIEIMKSFRNQDNLNKLSNGPGKLCSALNINKSLDGIDLTRATSELHICESNDSHIIDVSSSTRIGISKATELELRFYITDSVYTSR